jgi:hypothetical protein
MIKVAGFRARFVKIFPIEKAGQCCLRRPAFLALTPLRLDRKILSQFKWPGS